MRKRSLWPVLLTSVPWIYGASIALSQEATPPATESITRQAAQAIESVEVTARREALRKAVAEFVSTVTRNGGSNVARWNDPLCPWIAGALPAQQDFVKSRVGEIAKSVGARVDQDTNCAANLLIFL